MYIIVKRLDPIKRIWQGLRVATVLLSGTAIGLVIYTTFSWVIDRHHDTQTRKASASIVAAEISEDVDNNLGVLRRYLDVYDNRAVNAASNFDFEVEAIRALANKLDVAPIQSYIDTPNQSAGDCAQLVPWLMTYTRFVQMHPDKHATLHKAIADSEGFVTYMTSRADQRQRIHETAVAAADDSSRDQFDMLFKFDTTTWPLGMCRIIETYRQHVRNTFKTLQESPYAATHLYLVIQRQDDTVAPSWNQPLPPNDQTAADVPRVYDLFVYPALDAEQSGFKEGDQKDPSKRRTDAAEVYTVDVEYRPWWRIFDDNNHQLDETPHINSCRVTFIYPDRLRVREKGRLVRTIACEVQGEMRLNGRRKQLKMIVAGDFVLPEDAFSLATTIQKRTADTLDELAMWNPRSSKQTEDNAVKLVDRIKSLDRRDFLHIGAFAAAFCIGFMLVVRDASPALSLSTRLGGTDYRVPAKSEIPPVTYSRRYFPQVLGLPWAVFIEPIVLLFRWAVSRMQTGDEKTESTLVSDALRLDRWDVTITQSIEFHGLFGANASVHLFRLNVKNLHLAFSTTGDTVILNAQQWNTRVGALVPGPNGTLLTQGVGKLLAQIHEGDCFIYFDSAAAYRDRAAAQYIGKTAPPHVPQISLSSLSPSLRELVRDLHEHEHGRVPLVVDDFSDNGTAVFTDGVSLLRRIERAEDRKKLRIAGVLPLKDIEATVTGDPSAPRFKALQQWLAIGDARRVFVGTDEQISVCRKVLEKMLGSSVLHARWMSLERQEQIPNPPAFGDFAVVGLGVHANPDYADLFAPEADSLLLKVRNVAGVEDVSHSARFLIDGVLDWGTSERLRYRHYMREIWKAAAPVPDLHVQDANAVP